MDTRIKKFETVYDICNTGPHLSWIVPTLFMLLGMIIIATNWKKKTGNNSRRSTNIIVGCIIFGIASLITIAIVFIYADVNKTILNIYNRKLYQITEGEIENFVPMPREGHAHESFTLNGIYFEYSDFYLGHFGFNNAASHGGPIHGNGQYVRLTYVTDYYQGRDSVIKSNYIIKIELDQNQ